jgi:hypothetical protein
LRLKISEPAFDDGAGQVRLVASGAQYDFSVIRRNEKVVAPAIEGAGGFDWVRGHRRGQLLLRCRPNAELFNVRDANNQATFAWFPSLRAGQHAVAGLSDAQKIE